MVEHAADNGTAQARILAHLTAHGGSVTASIDQIAFDIGRTPRTTRRHLAALVAARRIRAVRRHDRLGRRAPSRWEVSEPPSGQISLACETSTTRTSCRSGRWWPPEVTALRDAMVTAGVVVSWRNLSRAVAADITAWVQTVGITKLVREAKFRTWGAVRHVAAYLRFWRAVRPDPKPVCVIHPHVHLRAGSRCMECARDRAARTRMPRHLFTHLLPSAQHPGRAHAAQTKGRDAAAEPRVDLRRAGLRW